MLNRLPVAFFTSSPPPLTPPSPTCSLKMILRHTGALGIPPDAVTACTCLADVHQLAKQYYHALARRFHPDNVHKRGPKATIAYEFQEKTRAYHALMAYDATWTLPHPLPDVPQDSPLPWALERRLKVCLDPGWQEWP